MATLRQRLENLTAARAPRRVAQAPSPLRGDAPLRVSEQLVPLDARTGLRHLADAVPEAAALLAPPSAGLAPSAPELPPPSRWLFLDVETTGLAGGTGTYAFLIGVGQLHPEGFLLRQFFLRDPGEEPALLTDLATTLADAEALVTYNGKLFDAPLLDTRFRLARAPARLERLPHLDVLYPARRLWKPRWGSARLADLERHVLRFERADDVPGEIIPQLYFDFLRGGDAQPLAGVFRHNADDIVTLAGLTGRLLHLIAHTDSALPDPVELFGLARLHERAGRRARARALYEQALAGSLPPHLEPLARLRLALLCKRQRDFPSAAALWQSLAENPATEEALSALEELAICYEHRLQDLEAAADATARALALLDRLSLEGDDPWGRTRRARRRFRHRQERLARKRARVASWLTAPLCGSNSPGEAP